MSKSMPSHDLKNLKGLKKSYLVVQGKRLFCQVHKFSCSLAQRARALEKLFSNVKES